MNRWRIAGLLVVALLAASFLLWYFLRPATAPVTAAPPAAREVFHASKPLHVQVAARSAATGETSRVWLQFELRRLLSRAHMRVAPLGSTPGDAFTLRVEIAADSQHATLVLIAPDRLVEREMQLTIGNESKLAQLGAFAARLPQFLNAAHGAAHWTSLIGTTDAKAYQTYLSNAIELLGPQGPGFTRPSSTAPRARSIESLEALTRSQPRFAHAWAALAAGYLSLGGHDEGSLSQLAESSAEGALSLDDESADAHAVLGLVHLRRSAWIAAREKFERALALDANNAPALEGFGCLLVDAGQYEAAGPVIARALVLQPGNIGARECLAYADTGSTDHLEPSTPTSSDPPALIHAVNAMLAGDATSAEQWLRSFLRQEEMQDWGQPLLRAAANRRRIPDALGAITRASNEGRMDAATAILCGVALRQSEFVFNRMARLQRDRSPVPLRVLWMPQADFLRRHARFEQIVSAAGLPAFWQEYGAPDACAKESGLYGCKLRAASSPVAGKRE